MPTHEESNSMQLTHCQVVDMKGCHTGCWSVALNSFSNRSTLEMKEHVVKCLHSFCPGCYLQIIHKHIDQTQEQYGKSLLTCTEGIILST